MRKNQHKKVRRRRRKEKGSYRSKKNRQEKVRDQEKESGASMWSRFFGTYKGDD